MKSVCGMPDYELGLISHVCIRNSWRHLRSEIVSVVVASIASSTYFLHCCKNTHYSDSVQLDRTYNASM